MTIPSLLKLVKCQRVCQNCCSYAAVLWYWWCHQGWMDWCGTRVRVSAFQCILLSSLTTGRDSHPELWRHMDTTVCWGTVCTHLQLHLILAPPCRMHTLQELCRVDRAPFQGSLWYHPGNEVSVWRTVLGFTFSTAAMEGLFMQPLQSLTPAKEELLRGWIV